MVGVLTALSPGAVAQAIERNLFGLFATFDRIPSARPRRGWDQPQTLGAVVPLVSCDPSQHGVPDVGKGVPLGPDRLEGVAGV